MTNAEAIETLRANYPDACYEQLREAVDAAIDALASLPPAQPEIILCKDCTWHQGDTVHGKIFCSREGAMDRIEPDSFCSYRERRTDE